MTTATTLTNQLFIGISKEAFIKDFQEFAIEEDMEVFNMDLIDDIDTLIC